uniref:Uncharacterized protein n=1 Tax=Oncorhynchus tshawytscha TaxID=74940 RepID=A0AAZ3P818_ONCTS
VRFGWGGFRTCTLLSCNEESKLKWDLFRGYNKSIRPAAHPTDKVEVQVKLILTNLISLEKTLTTNVWVQWNDIRLAWNTSVYFGMEVIRVPYNTVWLPEIILENNIDGKFDVAYYANVLIYSSEITYFPFDYQYCTVVFRSQRYSANEFEIILAVDAETNKPIEWVDIDPEAFTNGEWAIKHRPARKLINSRYTPDDLEYQEISFNLVIQREPLFYIINIILPCSLISSLVVLAYLLPTVFLFLIAQKVPETSLNVPLISKYLIFVMSVTTLIATNQIVVLNISLCSPNTHTMSHTPCPTQHVCIH